jgi:RNA-binding protein
VTPAVVAETQRALTAHELIKVRVDVTDREARRAFGEELAASADAAVVHRIGKVVILWRPNPLDDDR